jgi:hypothetical protein
MNCPLRSDLCAEWSRLTALEPHLLALEARVRSHQARDGDFREWTDIKRQLSELVGWYSRMPELRSDLAFDVCYAYLLAIWEAAP